MKSLREIAGVRAAWLARAAAAAVVWLTVLPGTAGEKEDALREQEAAREILSRLDRRLQGVTSMRGRFVQTFVSSGLGLPQSESGRFVMSRPDLMRWDYTDPEKKTAVSDGVHTWLLLPDDGVVYRGSVAAWKRGGAFAILSGGSLEAAYEAGGLDTVSVLHRGDVVLRLVPRQAREEHERLLVEVRPENLAVVAITAVDRMGNRIGAVFSDVEENIPLPRGLFSFDPPAGARIIDQDVSPTPP